MTAQAIQALVDAANAKDWDHVREVMSEDCVFEDVARGITVQGGDGFARYMQGFEGSFSDMRLEVVSSVGDGERESAEILSRGKHDGPLRFPDREIPATGKTVNAPLCWFAEISDGKITRLRDYYNPATFMAQLGVTT
jgi:steroid delta-isomerase-like uncharacterized protein